MAIDIDKEVLLTLTEATKIMPKVNGKRAAVSTLWRWCRRGLQGVYLEYLRIGRNIVTSREALNRFFASLAQADEPLKNHPVIKPACLQKSSRVEKQRQQSIEQAESILAEAGI